MKPLGLVGVPCGLAGASSHLTISRAGRKTSFAPLCATAGRDGWCTSSIAPPAGDHNAKREGDGGLIRDIADSWQWYEQIHGDMPETCRTMTWWLVTRAWHGSDGRRSGCCDMPIAMSVSRLRGAAGVALWLLTCCATRVQSALLHLQQFNSRTPPQARAALV